MVEICMGAETEMGFCEELLCVLREMAMVRSEPSGVPLGSNGERQRNALKCYFIPLSLLLSSLLSFIALLPVGHQLFLFSFFFSFLSYWEFLSRGTLTFKRVERQFKLRELDSLPFEE